MITTPSISVIVPVFCVEDYLCCCLDSILAQTFGDFELLLVVDGSTDGCSAICDEYAAADCRVRVIHKENGGVSSARNVGLDVAQGEYVAFCDGDDYWDKEWLGDLFAGITGSEVGIISAGYTTVSDEGKILSSWKSDLSNEGTVNTCSAWDKKQHILKDILTYKIGWAVWMHLFKSSIVRAHNVRFCESCENFAEDLGFLLEYSLYCNSVGVVASCGYRYVQREGSMMRNSVDFVRLNAMNEVSSQFSERVLSEDFEVLRSVIPVFHYLIMSNQYSKIIGSPRLKDVSSELAQIRNADWYWRQTAALPECKEELCGLFGEERAKDILLFNDYLQNKNWLLYRAKYYLSSRERRKSLRKRILHL